MIHEKPPIPALTMAVRAAMEVIPAQVPGKQAEALAVLAEVEWEVLAEHRPYRIIAHQIPS